MDFSKHYSTKATPQHRPIPGRKDMVKNDGGGFGFAVNPWARLDRFLILGSEGGTFYVGEREMTVQNADNIVALIKQDGKRVLDRVVEVSHKGLAPKNDPAIFALALICTFGDDATKKAAYDSITKVCRIGTHLFAFYENVRKLRKSSGGLKRGIRMFYEKRPTDKLLIQLMKYRQRNGWSQADVIRLAHPKFPKDAEGVALKLLGKEPGDKAVPEIWKAFEEIQTLKDKKDVKRAVELITQHKLPWEAVPTEMHGHADLWEAFLPNMGYTALLRNLSRLTRLGLVTAHGFDGTTKLIGEKFADAEALKESRLHPLTILNGMRAYGSGHSDRGDSSWTPSQKIVDILDDAFYAAFANVEPTGKNFLLGLDVSGSMHMSKIAGMALTPREASAALALVTARVEPNTYIYGFSNTFIEIKISKKSRLQDAIKLVSNLPFNSTDCSLPMEWAIKNSADVDVFAVYTDNDTNTGRRHPTQALEDYRQKSGKENAKLVVVGMTASNFTIADPKDSRQMDVVGFSTETPQSISAFVRM